MKERKNHFELYKIDGVGVDLSRFSPCPQKEKSALRMELGYSENDFIITVVAELNKNKNQILLIKSVPKLLIDIPNLKILLLGKESSAVVRQFVEKEKLERYVEFLGYRKNVDQFTKISDIAFSASLREGLPVNIIEAMACGLPVVVSENRGHCSLVKDKETGLMFHPTNETEMRNAILLLYKNPALRAEMGMRNVEEAKKYSVKIAINEMADIYTCCVTGRPAQKLTRGGGKELAVPPLGFCGQTVRWAA